MLRDKTNQQISDDELPSFTDQHAARLNQAAFNGEIGAIERILRKCGDRSSAGIVNGGS